MAGQDSSDRIAELLKQACPPTAASPEFKARLRYRLNEEAAALGTGGASPFWQRPFLWMPATAATVAAVAIIVYFAFFHSVPLTITTTDATAVQATAAILNGNLDSLGTADNVQVSFEWGTTKGYGNETAPEIREATGNFAANLSSLAPNTKYYYRVKVVTRHGVVYGPPMEFVTEPAPPAVTTRDTIKIRATSATLRGSLDALGSADDVSVSFEWGLTTDYGNETAPELVTGTGKYSAELSGLSPSTTYHFRAKAVGCGTARGADVQFTTDTVPPSVDTENATNISTTSASLNGDLGSMGTATSVAVFFEWKASGGSYTPVTVGEKDSVGPFSFDLTGLTPGTTYYFRAAADGDGDPVYGGERSLATRAQPSVTTNSATSVTADSATINGNLDSLGTADNVTVSFVWGTTHGGPYDNDVEVDVMDAAGSFSFDLAGLTPETAYYFRAKADGYDIDYGDEIMFTTASKLPVPSTWYLSGGLHNTVYVMYHDNTSEPIGVIPLHSDGASPASEVWRTDQSLGGGEYPEGSWTVHLALMHLAGEHEIIVEIGTCDDSGFNSYGSATFRQSGTNDEDVYEFDFSIPVDSFVVPSDGYVAARITATNRCCLWVDVCVGGAWSYVISPSYPEHATAAVVANASDVPARTVTVLSGSLDGLAAICSVGVIVGVMDDHRVLRLD
jgi:hypothetical protein